MEKTNTCGGEAKIKKPELQKLYVIDSKLHKNTTHEVITDINELCSDDGGLTHNI